eukprot:m51a1_g3576 putative domain containing protein (751) ;mRNA; f:1112008-1114858
MSLPAPAAPTTLAPPAPTSPAPDVPDAPPPPPLPPPFLRALPTSPRRISSQGRVKPPPPRHRPRPSDVSSSLPGLVGSNWAASPPPAERAFGIGAEIDAPDAFAAPPLLPSVPAPPLPSSPAPAPPVGPPEPAEEAEGEEEAGKQARMRAKAVGELVDTEQRYVEDLGTLLACYVTPLRDSARFPQFDRKDIQIVFSTVELIHEGNARMLADLREALRAAPDTAVGDTFLKLEDNLQFYSVFCNHQEEARASMEHILSSSSSTREYLDKIRDQTKGLGLLDYYVKPFQRLLKSHPDFDNLARAHQSLQRVVDKINLAKAHAENMRRMVAVCASVSGLKEFADPKRRFLREGSVVKVSDSNTSKRHLFLFNDFVLICKPQSASSKYTLKYSLPLLQTDVASLTGHEDLLDGVEESTARKIRIPCAFVLHATNVHKHWIFTTKAEDECTSWVKGIQAQVQLMLTFVRKPAEESADSPAQATGVIRVYSKVDSYKTFDIARKMSAREFIERYASKIVKNPPVEVPKEDIKLVLFVNGNERELDDKEIPLDIQTNLMSTGVQFGTPETHFRISNGTYQSVWSTRVNASKQHKQQRLLVGGNKSPEVSGDESSSAASPPPSPQASTRSPPIGRVGSASSSPGGQRDAAMVGTSPLGVLPSGGMADSPRRWVAGDWRASRRRPGSEMMRQPMDALGSAPDSPLMTRTKAAMAASALGHEVECIPDPPDTPAPCEPPQGPEDSATEQTAAASSDDPL